MRRFLFMIFYVFVANGLGAQTQDTSRVYTLADTVLADALFQEGVDLLEKEFKYKEALVKIQLAIEIQLLVRGVNHIDVAHSYNYIGICYSELEMYSEALENFYKALTIREKISGKNNKEVAWIYNNIGNVYTAESEYEKSINNHNNALVIRTNLNDSIGIATSFYNIGANFYYLGEYDKAIGMYDKSVKIRKNILDKEHLDIASTYNAMGVCFSDKGDFKNSMKYYTMCLDIRLKKLGTVHTRVAQSYNNIGTLHLEKKDFNKAISYFEKSLDIKKSLFDTFSISIAQSYANLATAYKETKNFRPEYLHKALYIFTSILGEDHPYIASVYANMGTMYLEKREVEKAIEYSKKSLEMRIKKFGDNHPDLMNSLNNLGYCYDEIKDYDQSLSYYQRALTLQSEYYPNDKAKRALFYNNIASAYKRSGKLQDAISNYRYAVQITDSLAFLMPLISLTQIYIHLYKVNNSPSQLDTAFSYAQQALAALQHQQNSISTDGSKAQLLQDNYSVYENAIQTSLLVAALDGNDSLRQAAFDYTEQSKAALLRAKIKESDALRFANIPGSLLEQEYNLRVDIAWRERQRREKLDAGLSETDSVVLAISSHLFDLRQQYDTLRHLFEREYPKYYALKYQLTTIGVKALQQNYLSEGQTLLEYFVGDSAIYIFVVNKNDFHVAKVKKDFPLDSLVTAMRKGISDRYDTRLVLTDAQRDEAPAVYCRSASKLYEKLIAPVKDQLKPDLLIIPDGILGYLPFEALLIEKPATPHRFSGHRYLLRDYAVSYCYSATLWKEMCEKQHRQAPKGTLLGMAPYFTGDTTLLSELFAHTDQVRKDLQPLPFAGVEVANIVELTDGTPLYGDKANKQAFDSLAPHYRILHLSTHGQANDRFGDYSFLAFGEQKDSSDQSLLYVRDLYNYALNADLVTLSACETGLGELQRGEGVVSLARAFSYAGAKGIVTSLWSVSDKKTQELMVDFYNFLYKGSRKHDALREAKLKLIKKSGDPYYWAGFVLIGDTQPVELKTGK